MRKEAASHAFWVALIWIVGAALRWQTLSGLPSPFRGMPFLRHPMIIYGTGGVLLLGCWVVARVRPLTGLIGACAIYIAGSVALYAANPAMFMRPVAIVVKAGTVYFLIVGVRSALRYNRLLRDGAPGGRSNARHP